VVNVLSKFKAIFELAGVEVTAWHEIKNKYWPEHSDYDHVRTPWYLAKTKWGLVEIGWRKRVIEINWTDTDKQIDVTKDDVTRGLNLVHAWTYAKAVEYMTEWRYRCEQDTIKK
jgi:hypothetical protein